MKPIQIDFATPGFGQRLASAGWRFVAIAMLICVTLAGAASFIVYMNLQREELQQQLSELQTQVKRLQKTKQTSTSSAPLAASQQAMGALAFHLNLSWAQLLRTFDGLSSKQVALLELVPDPNTRKIAVTAEARNSAQMTRYLESVKKQEGLSNVRLLHHEINATDPQQPIRFEFEVQWNGGTTP
jgi:mannitol-specific phosphotransferase system IIBC component